MTDTQSPTSTPPLSENFEVLALRHALEEAAVAVTRSETLLNSARSDLQNEKRNSAKLRVELEAAKARVSSLQSQVDQARLAQLILGESPEVEPGDSGNDEISLLKKEQTRLKMRVLEISKERDDLRTRLAAAESAAPSQPAPGSAREFLASAGTASMDMVLAAEVQATERPPLRLKA